MPKLSIEALAKRLKSPRAVQKFLRAMPYNREKRGETLRSAEAALRSGTAHCLEAALLAAAILERNGYPPLVLSFESQDGLDHVLFIYREKGRWGAVGRSRDEGLHGRPAIFRSIRDLAWSYFDPYVDKYGRVTAYQIAHLDDAKVDWRSSRSHVWKLERYLLKLEHRELKSSDKRYEKLYRAYLERGPMPRQSHWW
jgi:hypothetical protein